MDKISVHHGHHGGSSDCDGTATLAKGTAMAVLFLSSFTIGNLPIKLSKWFNWGADAKKNTYVKMLLGLGGGVLLCTTFIHLLPEVSESFEELNLTPDLEIHYAELLMCLGFFLMYFVEECVHVYLHRKEKLGDLGLVKKSLSIRRGEIDYEKNIGDMESGKPKTPETGIHNHCHDHHADHSHIIIDYSENSTVKTLRGLLVVLALSVHELFEGLAVGLECSTHHVWYMFGAVSAHKLVIAFCIGVELVASNLSTRLIVLYVFTFAVVSPLGIGIGILVSNSGNNSTDLVSVILQGIASGTLLYVIFFEILQAEKKTGLKQFLSILVGFIIMLAISMLNV